MVTSATGSVRQTLDQGNRRPVAQVFYREMKRIALVEQALLDLFAEGAISGTVHTSLGQEAGAVGIMSALDRERDLVFSNHRCHGHFLAYCQNTVGLIAEVMGRSGGVCGGIGGSQHLQERNFFSNGILGGMAPVATGAAMAEKIKGTGAVTVIFLGDGAMAEGVVYEAFNMAALWKLPILFAIEDNGYAQSTPTSLEQAGDLSARAEPWGIRTEKIDGRDVFAVAEAADSLVGCIRAGSGPGVLYMKTYRLGPHSKGDDNRDPAEIRAAALDQPLARLRRELDASWCDQCDSELAAQIAQAVQECKSMPVASFAELSSKWPR